MKGNCHAPVLAQEHLSRGEHAKCAGHVLTIPPLFLYTLLCIQALRKGLMLHHWKGITCLTTCQSNCHWRFRICKKKLDWWRRQKKKHTGVGEGEGGTSRRNHWDMNGPPEVSRHVSKTYFKVDSEMSNTQRSKKVQNSQTSTMEVSWIFRNFNSWIFTFKITKMHKATWNIEWRKIIDGLRVNSDQVACPYWKNKQKRNSVVLPPTCFIMGMVC